MVNELKLFLASGEPLTSHESRTYKRVDPSSWDRGTPVYEWSKKWGKGDDNDNDRIVPLGTGFGNIHDCDIFLGSMY